MNCDSVTCGDKELLWSDLLLTVVEHLIINIVPSIWFKKNLAFNLLLIHERGYFTATEKLSFFFYIVISLNCMALGIRLTILLINIMRTKVPVIKFNSESVMVNGALFSYSDISSVEVWWHDNLIKSGYCQFFTSGVLVTMIERLMSVKSTDKGMTKGKRELAFGVSKSIKRVIFAMAGILFSFGGLSILELYSGPSSLFMLAFTVLTSLSFYLCYLSKSRSYIDSEHIYFKKIHRI